MTGQRHSSKGKRHGGGPHSGGAHWRGHQGQGHGQAPAPGSGPPADIASVAGLLLYRDARQAIGSRLPDNGNAGLWWNKFCSSWSQPAQGPGNGGIEIDKLAWIKTVTGKKVGDAGLLAELHARRGALVERLEGQALTLDLQGRFVTGLGLEHPIENGFAWHHSLGVPYLAGAAVKGLTRAYAELWAEPDDEEQDDKLQDERRQADIARIFGGTEGGAGAGSVVFLDGLPTRPVQMAAEVATPHIGPWLQTDQSADNPPADWVDPNPIPFLTMERGQTLAFALLPRRAGDGGDCAMARSWLRNALTELGAGAKTAVGYGLFVEPGQADREPVPVPSPWLKVAPRTRDRRPVPGPPPRSDPPEQRRPVRPGTPGGFQPGDKVALGSDASVRGVVTGFEGVKVLVEFDDGEEALPPESLKRL